MNLFFRFVAPVELVR